jgi:hypothetical protein
LFPGAKRTGFGVNHLPLVSAEVKNEWSFTLTPPIRLYVVYRDFTVYLVCQFRVEEFVLSVERIRFIIDEA